MANREFLFRGKEEPFGNWVEGFLIDESHIGDWTQSRSVDPETVGQYVGRTDVNGKRIFEGDIVKAAVTENRWDSIKKYTGEYVVAYHPKYCYFYLKRNRNNLLFDGNWSYVLDSIEVIGNIHDNPELLEGQT